MLKRKIDLLCFARIKNFGGMQEAAFFLFFIYFIFFIEELEVGYEKDECEMEKLNKPR